MTCCRISIKICQKYESYGHKFVHALKKLLLSVTRISQNPLLINKFC